MAERTHGGIGFEQVRNLDRRHAGRQCRAHADGRVFQHQAERRVHGQRARGQQIDIRRRLWMDDIAGRAHRVEAPQQIGRFQLAQRQRALGRSGHRTRHALRGQILQQCDDAGPVGMPRSTAAAYKRCACASMASAEASPMRSPSNSRQATSPVPTMRNQNAGSICKPCSSAACTRQAVMARSLSSIKPSMSKITACGRNGSAAICVMRQHRDQTTPQDRSLPAHAIARTAIHPATGRQCGCDVEQPRDCRRQRTCAVLGGSGLRAGSAALRVGQGPPIRPATAAWFRLPTASCHWQTTRLRRHAGLRPGVMSYTLSRADLGEMIRCSSAPSSVINNMPLVSRSSRPTGASTGARERKRGGNSS